MKLVTRRTALQMLGAGGLGALTGACGPGEDLGVPPPADGGPDGVTGHEDAGASAAVDAGGASRMDVAVRDRGFDGQWGSGFLVLAELNIHRLASSGSGSFQAGIGCMRIVDHDLAHEIGGQTFGQRILAVELPVRIVRGE